MTFDHHTYPIWGTVCVSTSDNTEESFAHFVFFFSSFLHFNMHNEATVHWGKGRLITFLQLQVDKNQSTSVQNWHHPQM